MLKNKSVNELQEAVKNSTCIIEVFKYLGLNNPSSNTHYKQWKELVNEHQLDCSHFKKTAPDCAFIKKDIQDYLDNKIPASSSFMKRKLLSEGYMELVCVICNNTEWNGKPIPLQLDHIDGNSSNNNLSNLRLLCPNCHAQTDTYCGKNMKKKMKICPTCNKSFNKSTKFCSKSCVTRPSGIKKSKLSNEEIYDILLKNGSNYSKAAREIGMSDNAIRKRVRKLL